MFDPQGQPVWDPAYQQQMMMQQQMAQMQQQMNNMKEKDAFQPLDKKLESYNHGVIIKQKFEIMEALSGCEFPNVYHVYKRDEKGKKKGDKAFKYSEKSDCYDRCMTGGCKPFKMKVKSTQKDSDDNTVCMRCVKECKCVYYCCNRPEMLCYYTGENEQEEKFLGKCYDTWDCYHYSFKLISDMGHSGKNVDYTITASCMQCYFWCKCPCESCNEVVFFINDCTTPNIVGELRRKGRDCTKNVLMGDDADIFTVDFPKGSNWRQRAMLMNLTVFIDFSMFEDSSNRNQNNDMY